MPDRLHEPMPDGAVAGQQVDPGELRRMQTLYYQMIGCDPQTGHPTPAKLAELGVEWAAEI